MPLESAVYGRGPVTCVASSPGSGKQALDQATGHTLGNLAAPFRNPLRARVERKQDLASMIGKLNRDCSRGYNQGETPQGIEFEMVKRRRLAVSFQGMSIAENPSARKSEGR